MNLAIKIFVERDKRQPIEFIWRFCIKLASSSVYFKEAKCHNNEIMKINFKFSGAKKIPGIGLDQ